MTLDEQLKNWREATEPLEPSQTLLASLQATIDAPTPPAPAGLATVVKVLIITALVGALAVGYSAVNSLNLGWSGSSKPVATARPAPPSGLDAGPPSCGPESGPTSPSVKGESPEAERRLLGQLRAQLKARPLTCVAQRHPVEQILSMHLVSDQETIRLSARLAWLCGGAALRGYLLPPGEPQGSCDDSDWCRRPKCDLQDEACVLSWAERPASTCTAQTGRVLALRFACVHFLRAEAPEAEPRKFAKDPWCVQPAAVTEREFLEAHHAVKESP